MPEEHNADEPTVEKDQSTSSVNRRRFVKSLGAAGSVGVLGLGTGQASAQRNSVSKNRAKGIARRKVTQVALNTAGVSSEVSAFQLDEATERKVNETSWIQIPVNGTDLFAYNTEEDTAEVKPSSNTVVRAKSEDSEISVENLVMGEKVTDEALQVLKGSTEFEQALQNADVEVMKTDEAAASFDRESGTTMAAVPAKQDDGSDVLLMAEIAADDSLQSVHGLPSTPEGGVQLQDNSGIDCWAGCISFGLLCSNVCVPCGSAPTIPTCAPCAVCVGVSAAISCSQQCDIPKFW